VDEESHFPYHIIAQYCIHIKLYCGVVLRNTIQFDTTSRRNNQVESDRVSIQEASRMLGVSREKVRRMIQDGQLHAQESILDKRQKLIARVEIQDLLRRENKV
jgi:excisionase family DNA binding protein